MASTSDIVRIARRSEALKSLSLGPAPQLDAAAFSRFPEQVKAVNDLNEQWRLAWDRLKNMAAEAFMAARDLPP